MKETVLYIRATMPWRSPDAVCEKDVPTTPQQNIDRCLCCQFAQNACDRCDGSGNLKAMRTATYDLELLRDMLRTRVCKAQIARNIGVSRMTVYRAAKRMAREGVKA